MQVVVVVVGGGREGGVVVVVGGGGGDVVVVVTRGGEAVVVVTWGGAAVVGVADAAPSDALDIGASVDWWVDRRGVGVVVAGAPVVVVVGAADVVVVDGATVGAGLVLIVCRTSRPSPTAGGVGFPECGVRRKAAPSITAMTPRPAHMPHWRVGERSASEIADPAGAWNSPCIMLPGWPATSIGCSPGSPGTVPSSSMQEPVPSSAGTPGGSH
jgi:hypothetical protein